MQSREQTHEVGEGEPESKACMVKEPVSKKPKALVSHEGFKKLHSRKLQGIKHINDINILILVVCL